MPPPSFGQCPKGRSSLRDYYLYHIRWIFRKLPNGLWPPPPHPIFGKQCCAFFGTPKNLQRNSFGLAWPPPFFRKFIVFTAPKFPEKPQRNFSDRKWPPPIRKFSENSLNLVGVIVPKAGYFSVHLHILPPQGILVGDPITAKLTTSDPYGDDGCIQMWIPDHFSKAGLSSGSGSEWTLELSSLAHLEAFLIMVLIELGLVRGQLAATF